ncbi:5533_t:CDS:2, partial [Paraglomus occultum]
ILFISIHTAKTNDQFRENLIIKPLPDGKVLTHFEFSIHSSNVDESDYDLFPRSIGQIFQTYKARELHLTFTQGRWNYEGWGYPIAPSAGTGVELWAWLWKNDNLDKNWRSLTNALAGVFCASLNFIDEKSTVRPRLSFRPEGVYIDSELSNSAELRYGSLPHENVCTENLTPWLKLLPCKSKAGISSLLNSHKLYNSNFHSMSVHVQPVCQQKECYNSQLEILQTVSTVFDPVRESGKRDWSLYQLFDRDIIRACPLAVEGNIVLMLPEVEDYSIDPEPFSIQAVGSNTKRRFAVYDLTKLKTNLNLMMKWKEAFFEYDINPVQPDVYAHRYFT